MNPKLMRKKKIQRINRDGSPRVIDLFAGCGGLSLGFFSSGFEILGGIENNPEAACTYAQNFHPGNNNDVFSKARDITELSPTDFINELYPGEDSESLVDVIVGGPPCQAFARVGRAKLREVAEHPEAFKHDPRAGLSLQYLRFVDELHPLALIMENVIDILNFGGQNLAGEICDVLKTKGYICKYSTLNAVYYGVPEMRERFFLIALAKDLKSIPEFPKPTHWMELPNGYDNARKVALKTNTRLCSNQTTFKSFSDREDPNCWVPPPEATNDLTPAITAEEAIGDLPKIFDHLEGKLKRGVRRLDNFVPYPDNVSLSQYSFAMRNWPGFENSEGIVDHVIRYLPRDYEIFRSMQPGDQYPEAYQTANEMFKEKLSTLKKSGIILVEGTIEYENLKRATVPPYDPGKFPNKWRKMEANQPARTLMAHLGKDGYSHIHYDSSQARTISVREAARLQSFPDGFKFCGAMNSAFRQIGNAVPPLLARAIAITLYKSIRRKN